MPAPTDTPTRFLEKLYRATTHPLRLLPDFIIIGAQRGGTTSLYNYLVEHPSIGAASIKEIHFFDTARYRKGHSWYRAHFPSLLQKYYVERGQKIPFLTGEASPYYLFHPHAPRRIAQMLPNVKLIVMLRNPVDRAYSHYHHERAGGHEKLSSFEEAIACEEERLAGELEKMLRDQRYQSYTHRHFSYLARGIYADQLQTWMQFFPKNQFLLLKSEDFYANPDTIFKQTLDFLNLSTIPMNQQTHYKQYNDTKAPRLNIQTRERLQTYFAPHNARLFALLGRDFAWASQ